MHYAYRKLVCGLCAKSLSALSDLFLAQNAMKSSNELKNRCRNLDSMSLCPASTNRGGKSERLVANRFSEFELSTTLSRVPCTKKTGHYTEGIYSPGHGGLVSLTCSSTSVGLRQCRQAQGEDVRTRAEDPG